MEEGKKLTLMQEKFLAAYDGNASKAAEAAGYAHPGQAGAKLMRNPLIIRALDRRHSKENNPLIITRQQRQEFWTRVILGHETVDIVVGVGEKAKVVAIGPSLLERLRASELLGKSEGDFLERKEITGVARVIYETMGPRDEAPE